MKDEELRMKNGKSLLAFGVRRAGISHSQISILRSSFFIPFCLVLLCTGCGQATGDVVGKVTVNGQPASGGNVMMIGGDGVPHYAKIQEDGSYSVQEVPVGEVMISVVGGNRHGRRPGAAKKEKAAAGPPVPGKYRDPFNSGLKLEVKAGENSHDLQLEGELK